MDTSEITLIKDAIHNKKEPRHFMTLGQCKFKVQAKYKGKVVASSSRATVLHEVAQIIVDPVYYFPKDSVAMDLFETSSKKTHCPIKGDCTYFHIKVGGEVLKDAAWAYEVPIPEAAALKNLVAFDTSRIQVEKVVDCD